MLYRALLYLYPAAWRAEYGAEMRAVFVQRVTDAGGLFGKLWLWLEVLADVLTTAPVVQWDFACQDLKYAFRTLRLSPGFALSATLIAAMGIGTATAAFTLLDHVLIRPLGFHEPDRLVNLWEQYLPPRGGYNEASPVNYRDWKTMSRSFEAMGAHRGLSVALSGVGEPVQVDGASVTSEVFPLLGVEPALGRYFRSEDDGEAAGGTVVLSYGLWQTQFGGDPAALGRTIELDHRPYTVIGVMPRDFYFPNRTSRLWTAMRFAAQDFEDRTNTYIYPVARLRPGVTMEQATAEMHAIGARIAAAYPKEMAHSTVRTIPLQQEISDRTVLMLKVLLAAALCVLLIACANLAGMLLARSMTRRRELAVRAALGAGRERLIRQMLTESLLVAWSGAALGVAMAYGALPLLVKLVPTGLPIAAVPTIDGRILAFAVALTCVTGLGFGIVPAWRGAGRNAAPELAGGRSESGTRRERFRSALVAAEVAASIALLVGLGLLTRALMRVQTVDPGFDAEHAITMRTSLPMPKYESPELREAFYRRVLEGARRLPGVTAAAYTSFLPMVMRGGIWPVGIVGQPQDIADQRMASLRYVTPGFFAALRIPVAAGRDVREADAANAPYVAVVSRSFVKRYWPGENPLGRRIAIGNHEREIVGVVGDIRVRGPEQLSEPQVYVPWRQPDGASTWYAPKDLVVRTAGGDPAAIAPALRRIVRETDAGQPVSNVQTMRAVVEEETGTRRAQLYVLGAFAAMAFFLAAAGIHSLLAFAVSTRTQEIGIRVALGARQGEIAGMLLRDGVRLAVIGVAAGCAAGYGVGRLLESVLAGVRPDDPMVFGAAALVAAMMVMLGSLWPSVRALRVDPATAIRAT
jgi:putative ABC transport system permease protein